MPQEKRTRGRYPVPYLRQLREYAVLTQSQLAEQAGVGRATVIAAEKGDNISVTSIEKLAGALGMDKRALVYGTPQLKRSDYDPHKYEYLLEEGKEPQEGKGEPAHA